MQRTIRCRIDAPLANYVRLCRRFDAGPSQRAYAIYTTCGQMSPKILNVVWAKALRRQQVKTTHVTNRGSRRLTLLVVSERRTSLFLALYTKSAVRGPNERGRRRRGSHLAELSSVVILKAEVGDEIFAAQVPQSILQFHELNEDVVFRVQARRSHGGLEIEREPLLHAFHAGALR